MICEWGYTRLIIIAISGWVMCLFLIIGIMIMARN